MGTAVVAIASVPASIRVTCRPRLSALLYVLSDILAILLAWSFAIAGRLLIGGDFLIVWYLRLFPILGVCLISFAMRGLYPANGIGPVEQFRRATIGISVVYTSLIVFTFFEKEAETYSRLVFFFAWIFSVIFIPLNRAALRKLFRSKDWWGTPAVILGTDTTAQAIIRLLQNDPGLGIRAQAAFGLTHKTGDLEGIPILGSLAQAATVARMLNISTVIVALPDIAVSFSQAANRFGKHFAEVLIVPDALGPTNLSIESRGLGNFLTISVRQNLLMTGPRTCKYVLDRLLVLIGGLAFAPLMLIIVILVKLTSRGPVFYGHMRIGKNQRAFTAWKFRTMVVNADQALAERLSSDPALRLEWERNHKLRNDPRVTKIGKFLRHWSIDELPQIWNVLCGEMSLIGPRPIVSAEVARYADYFEEYTRVLPGLTGLWQVSGRSEINYKDRVELDASYVHNWSPWLDFYILARTFVAVLNRRGAC